MAELKIKADSGGGTVGLKGPATTTDDAAIQLTLPVDDGTANQYLKTDGSGALSWSDVSSVGAATAVGFNDNVKISLGTGNDSEFYYSGTDNYFNVKNGKTFIRTGDEIRIQNDAETETIAKFIKDGACEFYHNNTLSFSSGANGVVMPSGKGIDFSATANTSATGASMSSELFEDYEEGSWTPTIAAGSATFNNCDYIRIGNMCWINFECTSVSDTTSSTDWLIAAASLPFASSTSFSDNQTIGPVRHRYTSHADGNTIVANMNGSGIHWTSNNDATGDKAFSSFKHSHVDASYSAFGFSGWYNV